MKIIVIHKKQLLRPADVKRFIRYIYGKGSERPIMPVEGFLPGLPTLDPALDTDSLLTGHHGGKAAAARSVVISSEYFPDRETAMAHAPAMSKCAAAFRSAQAPNANALSVVHLSTGVERFTGMWRLDCHLLLRNSDGARGLQWTRQQCSHMQDLKWIPETVRQQYHITPGKGTGTRRLEKIPYPKSKNLISYEIGTLTDPHLETGLYCGVYASPRRAKNGRIISLEVDGKRINIARARHLVAVRNGNGEGKDVLPNGGATVPHPSESLPAPGINQIAAISIPEERTDYNLGATSQGRGPVPACALFILKRRRRLSSRYTGRLDQQIGILGLGASVRRGPATAVAGQNQAGTIVKKTGNTIHQITAALENMESVELFTQ